MPKQITPSDNAHHWPRNAVESVECRKRDVVIRVTDWWDDEDEPAFDVEVYIGGVYDWNESRIFSKSIGIDGDGEKTGGHTKQSAKLAAAKFAGEQLEKLL